jgi:hypothetical protein
MNITSEIDSMILEMTRSGIAPKYIILGLNQYQRWAKELRDKGLADNPDNYMGYDIIICNSDIIEVVTNPRDQYKAFLEDALKVAVIVLRRVIQLLKNSSNSEA